MKACAAYVTTPGVTLASSAGCPSRTIAGRLRALGVIFSVAACAGPTSEAPSAPTAHAAPTSPRAGQAQPVAAAAQARIIEGSIVEEGPLGDGPCVQKSYRVQPTGGGESVWIHFERCQDTQGPSPGGRALESLDVGQGFRFTVRDGASPNFGDAPVLLDAVPVDASR